MPTEKGAIDSLVTEQTSFIHCIYGKYRHLMLCCADLTLGTYCRVWLLDAHNFWPLDAFNLKLFNPKT